MGINKLVDLVTPDGALVCQSTSSVTAYSTHDFPGHGVDFGLTTARRPHDWRGRSCMRRGTSRRQRGRLQAPAANDWQGLLPFRLCVRKAIVPDGATRHRQSPPRLVGLWQRDGGCRRLAVARRGGNQPAAESSGGTGAALLEVAAALPLHYAAGSRTRPSYCSGASHAH